jgi:hypothetical protein
MVTGVWSMLECDQRETSDSAGMLTSGELLLLVGRLCSASMITGGADHLLGCSLAFGRLLA